jgi:S-DNA-T family DNA segregation ATPase FtsK/SpoIIIE
MATRIAGTGNWRGQVQQLGRRVGAMLGALAVLAFALMIGFALASYSSTDPAMMTAAGGPVRNVLGPAGAWSADLLLTFFGLPAILLIPP